jgi:hypothetical protein
MSEAAWTSDTVGWQPELLKADLCLIYGHQGCGGHEVDADANIIVCTCWCHSEELART